MNAKQINKIKRLDRLARRIITLGGAFVILCVVAILALIVKVTIPLFMPATVTLSNTFHLDVPSELGAPALVGLDEYGELGFVVGLNGGLAIVRVKDGMIESTRRLTPPSESATAVLRIHAQDNRRFSALWNDGSISLETLHFETEFDQTRNYQKTRRPVLERLAVFPPLTNAPLPALAFAIVVNETTALRVEMAPDRRISITQRTTKKSLVGKEITTFRTRQLGDPLPSKPVDMVMAHSGQALYVALESGTLMRWIQTPAGDFRLTDDFSPFSDKRQITALALISGDTSLALGDSEGEVTVWFPVGAPTGLGEKKMRLIHTLPPMETGVQRLLPSPRDKTLLAQDQSGRLVLNYVTTERRLIDLNPAAGQPGLVSLGDAAKHLLVVDPTGQWLIWSIQNPHPEISWNVLFGKVWYEGYPEPAHVWQSSSASDDYEPKISLLPLIFGTIKGTLYALLFSVPLALFGALYVSQFAAPLVRRFVKPTVELMAAVPSVVIGFLAALWFAPLLEQHLLGFLLCTLTLPLSVGLWMLLWRRWIPFVPGAARLHRGLEFIPIIPLLILAGWITVSLAPFLERHAFQGSFNTWLFTTGHVRYDLRNCVVIAFALGFAVIPIIFTLSEDALSNVPYSFTAASLALGASRWQTVWHVILPSASPGIFAGIMIGLGRAVGETMIVLMATGNTPIMDWSIFNGMRTLSANIAVELPEAPLDGTLYRLLFLSAVILFVMTFILNTVAEITRQRLRKKFGRY